MKQHSLTKRVVFMVLFVELLCAGCFSGLSLWHEWRTRVQAIDALLQGRSDSLLGAVQDAEDPADNVYVDPTELKVPAEDLFSVYNQAGVLLGGTERNAFPLTERQRDGFRSVHFRDRRYRVLQRQALRIIDRPETGGLGIRRPITIVYAIPISTAYIWREILKIAGFYIFASLLLAALTAVVLLAWMTKLLHPVQELAAAAAGVSPASLVFEPPDSARRVRELQPLVDALTSTITGLREAFEKQHRFVSDAAHELKTAVAVVRSSIQVLDLRTRSAEEYKAGLRSVLADNERVEDLVARMLLLAQLEERSQLPAQPADLSACVRAGVAALCSYAAACEITFQVALTENLPVQVSPEDLHALATNLMVNAVQHSSEGSSVAVRVFRDSNTSGTALFEVEDHGEGVPAKDLPFVFDRFYRADPSRSRKTGGAGLGLAICKTIVERAGGHIELASVPGHGTTARVTLPLAAQRRSIPAREAAVQNSTAH